MKLNIYKYIFREIWPTFLAVLFVFIFIMLATRMIQILEWVINQGVPLLQVAKMILFLSPNILLFSLPAAMLMAVFVAFLRLSSDNEILAMKCSGISLYQMLPPVLFMSLLACVMAFLIGIFCAPWGNRTFKDLIFQIAQSNADLGIKERIFCEPFDGVTFYINNFSQRERSMKHVFLMDRRDPANTVSIVADKGRIFSHPRSRTITVQFTDGTIFITGKDYRDVRTVKFDSYDFVVGLDDIMPAISSREKAPAEMFFHELIRNLKTRPKGDFKYNEIVIEIMEKFTIPVAVFLMGVIGVPLGAQIKTRSRFHGIVISLVIFLLYYMTLVGVRGIGETGILSPLFGSWLPDLFLFIFCWVLLNRAANERSFKFPKKIPSFKRRSQNSPAFF